MKSLIALAVIALLIPSLANAQGVTPPSGPTNLYLVSNGQTALVGKFATLAACKAAGTASISGNLGSGNGSVIEAVFWACMPTSTK